MRIDGASTSSRADWPGDRAGAPRAQQRPRPPASFAAAPEQNAPPQGPRQAEGQGPSASGQAATPAARAMVLRSPAGEAERRDLQRFARLVDQVCCDLGRLGALDRPPAGGEGDDPIPPRYVDVRV
jgi:hypothetical protein